MTSSNFQVDSLSNGQPADVKNAVEAEVQTFDRRERMVADFKVCHLVILITY